MINKISKKNINKEEEIFTHKNYGNTPNYLKQFQLEEIKKRIWKNFRRRIKCSKRIKLIPENERINTLNVLINTKKKLKIF